MLECWLLQLNNANFELKFSDFDYKDLVKQQFALHLFITSHFSDHSHLKMTYALKIKSYHLKPAHLCFKLNF